MAETHFAVNGNALTVRLSGHIDSSNAAETESAINEALAGQETASVTVDCGGLEYVSSAGLRIILRLRKAVPDTRLENVSQDVYDVLEMTGFTEMMDVRKAYRRISVEGCEVIGRGANGMVYRIDPDTIVKVYLNPDALPEINRERELARTAFVLGVPTAIPYDVVSIEGGGYGSVFELLNAKSLAKLLTGGEKTVGETADISVGLLKTIHGTAVKPGSMPDMKKVALDWADFLSGHLPARDHERLRSLIEEVPDDLHMLHGDYHIKNVMVQNGEALLIDMDTLCHGNPVFEFGSMFNAYAGYSELDSGIIEDFLGITRETGAALWRRSLELYFGTDDDDIIGAAEKKAMVIGYTRMMRRAIRRNGYETADGRAVIENCRRKLSELIFEIDSLAMRLPAAQGAPTGGAERNN